MFAALGRAVVHHPWRVILVWLIGAVAVIALAPKLTSTSNEASFLPGHYESIQAQDLQQSAFPQGARPGGSLHQGRCRRSGSEVRARQTGDVPAGQPPVAQQADPDYRCADANLEQPER